VYDFYEFLEGFFELNENYRGRKIYLSGFSFAGHWIPAIAENILSKNNSNINLAGISIGNGIVSNNNDNINLAFILLIILLNIGIVFLFE